MATYVFQTYYGKALGQHLLYFTQFVLVVGGKADFHSGWKEGIAGIEKLTNDYSMK